HTSALIQAAVHRFCERRLLDRHVARIAAEYRRRRDTLVAALKRRMPEDVTWTEPEGGFSLLVTLPAGLDAGALLPRARERAGAAAVMALERGPSDIRKDGGVARMSPVKKIQEIQRAVTIPVMAKARIGHFVEAQILEALGIDFIDESEVLTPADEHFHSDKF